MSIIITGGAGFIGKNLILYLRNVVKEDCRIIVIDNFKTSEKGDFETVTSGLQDIVLYEYDITNWNLWDIIRDAGEKVKEIYHLASIASPVLYKKNPLATLDVGYIGTRNVMEYSLYNNSRVLFASSSEVYGEATISPQHEDYYGNTNIFGERSSYDCSKRVGEALMYTYKTTRKANVRIARIFNTYGPLMNLHDGRLVTELIKGVMLRIPVTIYGDGTQKRSMCFVDDTVSMLYKLMKSDCDTPVNIGNDNELKVNDVVYELEKLCVDNIDTLNTELTQNDPLHRKPCLEKNKSVLGKREYTSLKSGLQQTLEYFHSKYNFKF
jgi:nucleoside-diphosphate-sugar epimerase